MIAMRSGSLIVDQAVISAPVRPQPMHKADERIDDANVGAGSGGEHALT